MSMYIGSHNIKIYREILNANMIMCSLVYIFSLYIHLQFWIQAIYPGNRQASIASAKD